MGSEWIVWGYLLVGLVVAVGLVRLSRHEDPVSGEDVILLVGLPAMLVWPLVLLGVVVVLTVAKIRDTRDV